MSSHEVNTNSPYRNSPARNSYLADPFSQDLLVREAFERLMVGPFEAHRDLRGAQIVLTVSDDGETVFGVLNYGS